MGKHRGNGEGTIVQRTDGRWTSAITAADGKRKFFYGKTRKEVAEKLAKAQNERQNGTLITSPDQTLGQFLTTWLADLSKPSVRPKTYENYERQVRVHLIPGLGKIRLSKLSAQDLNRFYRQQREGGRKKGDAEGGLKASTIGRQHAILHKALDDATRLGLVARNVADLDTPPRIETREMQPFSADEVERFLAAARADRYFALFVMAALTGMRQGELLGLTWPLLDLDHGVVSVRQQLVWTPKAGFSFSEPKSASGRRAIKLPPKVVEVLRRHRKDQVEERLAAPVWEDFDLVFPNEVGRPEERGNLVRRHFQPILKKAELPAIRFHDLRHTAATLLIGLGEYPKVIQSLLGHASYSLTMDRYAHVLPAMQEGAASKLEGRFGESLAALLS